MPETDTNSPENKHSDLINRFSHELDGVEEFRGDLTLVLKPNALRDVLTFLKTDSTYRFALLLDLLGVDYLKCEPEKPGRFAVVYVLYSFHRQQHLRLKVYLGEEAPSLPSVHDIFAAANWFEREVWDLFGIHFIGHPNLVRILCHTEFVGHPLRKDYPSDQYQRLKTAAPSTGF